MVDEKKLSTIFFGSSDLCLPILQSLKENFHLSTVITRPDKAVGRSNQPTPSQPKQWALKNNIPVLTPTNKSELLLMKTQLTGQQPDVAVVADYGLIIPEQIFTIPRYKTVNIHFSKLPSYRGASPVYYTLLSGDKSAWITFILMDASMDTGNIILQKEFPITGNETGRSLYLYLFTHAAELLPQVITNYTVGKIKPIAQMHELATFTRRLKRSDGYIPYPLLEKSIRGESDLHPQGHQWPEDSLIYRFIKQGNKPAEVIDRAVRAFIPWPEVWTKVKIKDIRKNKTVEKILKILKSHQDNGRLIIDTVQMEGKNPVSWKQFQEAYLSRIIF